MSWPCCQLCVAWCNTWPHQTELSERIWYLAPPSCHSAQHGTARHDTAKLGCRRHDVSAGHSSALGWQPPCRDFWRLTCAGGV